ncbi:hypothetical protein E2C01_030102 [Portunus trituberculatus]|uniref:Uncharacterized protein n=1 Tax=Portunus trituberculatus TaxID=210409 RepID=A0A5B7ETV3_PORTR|nr:hypothetical protein [Portunus trituberculatus]
MQDTVREDGVLRETRHLSGASGVSAGTKRATQGAFCRRPLRIIQEVVPCQLILSWGTCKRPRYVRKAQEKPDGDGKDETWHVTLSEWWRGTPSTKGVDRLHVGPSVGAKMKQMFLSFLPLLTIDPQLDGIAARRTLRVVSRAGVISSILRGGLLHHDAHVAHHHVLGAVSLQA